MTVDTPISILHITEYTVIQLGVAVYLKNTDYTVRHSDSINGAVRMLADGDVDIVIIDLALLKPSGLAAIKVLLKHDPGLKIIVLSRNEREPFITQGIDNGALGYLSLRCTQDELIDAIHTVYRNERYLSRDVAYGYAMANLNKSDHALSSLTAREYQVFTLLAKGTSIADIAAALFISPKTVHVYRANLFAKLKLTSSYELTLLALRQGVISIDVLEN